MLSLVDGSAAPWQALSYARAFFLRLILLERGADWRGDASAALARRLHAPQTLVGPIIFSPRPH